MHNKFITAFLVIMIIGTIVQVVMAGEDGSPCLRHNTKLEACITVKGNLHVWNGWPPNLRIETSDHKRVFGLGYDDEERIELLPPIVRKMISLKNQQLNGQFEVCPLGEVTTVLDEKRTIEWACLGPKNESK